MTGQDARLDLGAYRRFVVAFSGGKPRLRNVDGLWRKPVLGRRGATPRPGSITAFIRERGLLPPAEVDYIIATAPTELIAFQAAQAVLPLEARTSLGHWLENFNCAAMALAH